MMTIEAKMTGRLCHTPPSLYNALRAAWRAYAAVRRQRRVMFALSKKSPRVLRDMGFDPEAVYQFCGHNWDKLDPAIRDYYRVNE